jgi:Universal stress protein family
MTTVPYRIVVGVDGTPAGVRALRWAFRQAAARSGVVEAVIVTGRDRAVVTDSDQVHRNEGERILSEAIVVALGDNPASPCAREWCRALPQPGWCPRPPAHSCSCWATTPPVGCAAPPWDRSQRRVFAPAAAPVVVVPDAAVSAIR